MVVTSGAVVVTTAVAASVAWIPSLMLPSETSLRVKRTAGGGLS